jgi:hypothetical protein
MDATNHIAAEHITDASGHSCGQRPMETRHCNDAHAGWGAPPRQRTQDNVGATARAAPARQYPSLEEQTTRRTSYQLQQQQLDVPALSRRRGAAV